ncbi:lysosomal cobalamin transporter [Penicillium frequentans]|uniref:Probable lysosomal cobalamin transporter n=1 Tax=Penicillium frequentans TaxID=3151616 RepID=A0AAD6D3E9_9EURO|nr:lysosomal cobalamin transporter [Penicillium glabrum]
MALLQTSLIWVVYAVVIAILLAIASVFIYVYQTPRDRSPSVTLTCIIAITSLLATVLLLPVDVALISSTTSSRLGRRKDWATQDTVDNITFSLTIIYYILYSLDALLCLLVIPFTYFWYEEYDEVASETGEQTVGQRLWGSFKYTLSFIAIVVILFLVGFFVPVSKDKVGMDLDYFKRLLTENHGERALTFALGLLMTLGICLYVLYTSVGLALFPISLIKTAPSISSPTLRASTVRQLEANQERLRQLEGRCGGNPELLSSKDRRELDTLTREERTLIRRQRLVDEAQGEGRSWLMRAWFKIEAIFRPFKLLGGLLLLLIAFVTWVSMLLTAIDKAKNSVCKHRCGYILGHINVFNPVNWALVQSAKVFPVDYAIFSVLVLLLFCSSVAGISVVGIRFLWIRIFQIRKGHTSPQALLLATAMLMLIILALNYSISMVLAPQYATFGPQTFCDRAPRTLLEQPDCSNHKALIKPCSELAENPAAQRVCTPSVVSTFLNRVTLNFPFFGVVFFWAQFFFLGLYLVVFVTSLFRSPRLDERQLDEDAEEAEEEGLLANTGRRFNATWQDITGRADRNSSEN